MTLRLEKIALVFKLRIVPTSSEDSWTIIFVCPYVLWVREVQVAHGLPSSKRSKPGPFTLEILNSSERYLLMLCGRNCA